MNKLGIAAGAGAVAIAMALTAGSALAAAPKAGGTCTKLGQTAKVGKVNLVCSKSGKKLAWTIAKAKTATTTKPATAALPVKIAFSGQAQVKQSGSNLDIKADATGTGAGFNGSAHLTGAGQGNSDAKPCPVFTGPGAIEGSGDKISFTVDPKSSGCPDQEDNNQVIVTGNAIVDGGSGKYAKAKGTLHFDGTFNRNSSNLSITFSGSLTSS